MTTVSQNIILKERQDIPEYKVHEILDFIRFIKLKSRSDETYTQIASEQSLAQDWLLPEEDIAWKDL